MNQELDVDITFAYKSSAQTYRILDNAILTNRTSFADLDDLIAEDLAMINRVGDIRQELETLTEAPYTSENGERCAELTESWLRLDPRGFLGFLNDEQE